MNVVKASLIKNTIEPVATITKIVQLENEAAIKARKLEKKIRKKLSHKIYKLYRSAQKKAKQTLETRTATAIDTFFDNLSTLQTEHSKTLEYKSLELALSIAESVLMAEVETNIESLRQRSKQLATTLRTTNECIVLVHPDLQERLQSVIQLPVASCPNIPPGDIAIQTNSGVIQTDFRQHFDIVKGLILSSKSDHCAVRRQATCN